MTANSCDHLIDYFNHALTPEETTLFEAHLKTCTACQSELEEWQLLTEALPLLSEPVTPPEGMKARILGNILSNSEKVETASEEKVEPSHKFGADEPTLKAEAAPADLIRKNEETLKLPVRKKSWMIYTLAACLVLSLISNVVLFSSARTNRPEAAQEQPASILDQVIFKASNPSMSADATIIKKNNSYSLVIQATHLKPLTGSKVYKAWLIKNGKAYPAGTFQANKSGDGVLSYPIDKTNTHWDAVAISIEPNPASPTPHTVIMSGKLSGNL
jgi:hypothetical protein